MTVIQIRKK